MTVATPQEIVDCFNHLDPNERNWHNWGTCMPDCRARWSATDETYINGVMMTLDFDFIMGYLIQTVDRESSRCRYLTIVQYHGRADDGSIEHTYEVSHVEHEFFAKNVDQAGICKWAVNSIYRMLDEHRQ